MKLLNSKVKAFAFIAIIMLILSLSGVIWWSMRQLQYREYWSHPLRFHPELENITRPDIDWSEVPKVGLCTMCLFYGTPWGPTGHWNGWNSGDSRPDKIIDNETGRRDL